MHDDTIKPPPLRFRITPELRPVLYFIVGCGVCVLGFDVYYMLYIHEPALNTLTEDKFRKFKLREITQVSPTTSLFSFAALIPDAQRMVIPSHIVVKDDTCQIARSYTPISYSNNQFDILVRKYEQGSVSKFIHALTPGDRVEMRGPIQTFPYKRDMAQHIGMVQSIIGI